MIRTEIFKDDKGVSLIELLIVLVIIGILAGVGLPQYGRFVSKNEVRGAATKLMQNMRMARTMAIKENRVYVMTFPPAANTYTIGFDTDSNGIPEGYGQGPIKTVNVQIDHGVNVVLGSANFAVDPASGQDPNGDPIINLAAINFRSDSSSDPNGMIFFQHIVRGYTFAVEHANTAGKTNLFVWQGDIVTPSNGWTELR